MTTENDELYAPILEALRSVVAVGCPHDFQQAPPHIRRYCYDITKAVAECYIAFGSLLLLRRGDVEQRNESI